MPPLNPSVFGHSSETFRLSSVPLAGVILSIKLRTMFTFTLLLSLVPLPPRWKPPSVVVACMNNPAVPVFPTPTVQLWLFCVAIGETTQISVRVNQSENIKTRYDTMLFKTLRRKAAGAMLCHSWSRNLFSRLPTVWLRIITIRFLSPDNSEP